MKKFKYIIILSILILLFSCNNITSAWKGDHDLTMILTLSKIPGLDPKLVPVGQVVLDKEGGLKTTITISNNGKVTHLGANKLSKESKLITNNIFDITVKASEVISSVPAFAKLSAILGDGSVQLIGNITKDAQQNILGDLNYVDTDGTITPKIGTFTIEKDISTK